LILFVFWNLLIALSTPVIFGFCSFFLDEKRTKKSRLYLFLNLPSCDQQAGAPKASPSLKRINSLFAFWGSFY